MNMYTLYYNSGTTNTRCYLLKDGQLVVDESLAVGSRNSAIDGNNEALRTAIVSLKMTLLSRTGIKESDIDRVFMSGMVSSPNGLKEIPHLPAPVNMQTLLKNIVHIKEPSLFEKSISIIPGVKTIPAMNSITAANVWQINNMRGEEIEIFGILNKHKHLENGIMILPGSHTQVAFVRQGAIVDIMSTITGELFDAISKGTILASSLRRDHITEIECGWVQHGYELLENLGFNRAIYTVRSMGLFADTNASQRQSVMEGILNGGVLKAIDFASHRTLKPLTNIAVCGSEDQFMVVKAIANGFFPVYTVEHIPELEIPFSVYGMMHILEG